MKRLFIGFIVFFTGSYSLLSQTEEKENIKIESLSDKYNYTDTINIILTNDTEGILYYSISFEEKTGDSWITTISDIFQHANDQYNAMNVRLLHPAEKKTILFTLSELLEKEYFPYGLCRFKYEIKPTPFETQEILYSNEFLIQYY